LLRSQLRYLDVSKEEFDAILEVRTKMANDKSLPPDVDAAKASECAALTEILGEDRGREYERITDWFYIWSRDAADRDGLPPETATQAWEVKRDTLGAADQIRRALDIPDEDKKRRLDQLQRQAESRLNDILGAHAARLARHGDGVWLQNLPLRTRP
jgi:hypothetical protein